MKNPNRPLNFDKLASRIDLQTIWSDVTLPESESTTLHNIVARFRAGKDVPESQPRTQEERVILFTGPWDSGKRKAAEVIARDLGLELYHIDLSAVISKYIGETEKNLQRIFDAAVQGSFILFFDEADALFGKRSDVKDSHDRYANIEINYLLQRMEAYRGLAILATNKKSALDPAFLRRLRTTVNFPHPKNKASQE
jgi:SpoVK/Ycf46/Vps4 family AAA+-type ATPase